MYFLIYSSQNLKIIYIYLYKIMYNIENVQYLQKRFIMGEIV